MQFRQIRGEQHILELRIARPAAGGDVLDGAQKHLGARQRRQLRPQAVDDALRSGARPLGDILQRDEKPRRGGRGIAIAAAHRAAERGHRRVAADDLGRLIVDLHHGAIGGIGRGLHHPHDQPGILLREEILRHDGVEPDRHPHEAQGEDQHQAAKPQHMPQRPDIAVDQPRHAALELPAEPAMRAFLGSTHPGCDHRRDGERDDGGNCHRYRQCDGKFAKQPPHNARHEEQRDEHRDERQRDREHGKADLPRPFEGCRHAPHAALAQPRHVLDHDNGIIDHEPHRNGERHEREIVQRIAHQPHHRERAQQGERHRDGRRHHRRRAPQEQRHHRHHQHDGNDQRVLHLGH